MTGISPLTLHGWATPNAVKVVILLEELGLPYVWRPIDLRRGEQRSPAFVALNPNGKIPVLEDAQGPDGGPLVLTESAAILVYLADKTGRFGGEDARARVEVLQWLMFQMSAVGPIFGQLHHFRDAATSAYATERFEAEGRRILRVLDRQVAAGGYLVGDDYTIADICTWPWVRSWQRRIGLTLDGYDAVTSWFETIGDRPAVVSAVNMYERLLATPGPKG